MFNLFKEKEPNTKGGYKHATNNIFVDDEVIISPNMYMNNGKEIKGWVTGVMDGALKVNDEWYNIGFGGGNYHIRLHVKNKYPND